MLNECEVGVKYHVFQINPDVNKSDSQFKMHPSLFSEPLQPTVGL